LIAIFNRNRLDLLCHLPEFEIGAFNNNLISLRMELTITFFIKFALGVNIILALFFIGLPIIKFIINFDFRAGANFSNQFSGYANFLFSKSPNADFVDEKYCCV
jgi:hypothetical protein